MSAAARGGATRGPATASVLLALLVSGCVTAGSLEPARTPSRSWDHFAATAEPLATPTTRPATTAPTTSTPRRVVRRTVSSSGELSPAPSTSTERAAWHVVLEIADPRDDTGLAERRPYADLVELRIAEDGANVRLSVTVAGTVPDRLAEGEVVGLGIDFFRTAARESDYQVFVDGGEHGWRAFLHAPEGIVRFPGTLRIADRRFVIDLPWSSLGGRSTADVSGFADWSLRGTVPASTQDSIPDTDTRQLILG